MQFQKQLHQWVVGEDTGLGQAFLELPTVAAFGEMSSADTCHDYSVSRQEC
jgi:hypothetical protein